MGEKKSQKVERLASKGGFSKIPPFPNHPAESRPGFLYFPLYPYTTLMTNDVAMFCRHVCVWSYTYIHLFCARLVPKVRDFPAKNYFGERTSPLHNSSKKKICKKKILSRVPRQSEYVLRSRYVNFSGDVIPLLLFAFQSFIKNQDESSRFIKMNREGDFYIG